MHDFDTIANQTLEKLADFFESSWPEADIDLFEDTLAVNLSESHQYIINKHRVTKQIWVASPFTGAHHFQYKEGQWQCTRTDMKLDDFFLQERDNYAT